MPCYHPKFSILQRSDGEKWKVTYNVLREHDEVHRNKLIYDNTYHVSVEDSFGEILDTESIVVPLPCGKCIGCRLDQSRQWAQRCVNEVKTLDGKNCHFVTLTYDDDHLLWSQSGQPTLPDKNAFSKELKRLRSRLDEKGLGTFRFFMCSEYGEKYKRPHHHVIFFGLQLPDLKWDQRSQTFRSEFLEKWWQKGYVSIGHVSYQSVAYTARYCLKKQGMPYYEKLGIVPEWTNMSNRPGIGREWYEQHKNEIYQNDKIYQKVGERVMSLQPARYYDKLFDIDDHEKCEAIKAARRRRGDEMTILKVIESGKDYFDMLVDAEEAKAYQIARLKRQYEEG